MFLGLLEFALGDETPFKYLIAPPEQRFDHL